MPPTSRGVAAVVGAAVLFGTSGAALELGPDSATPLGTGAVRITIGVVVLWAAVLVGGDDRRRILTSIRGNRSLIVLGGLGVAAYTPSFFEAVERSGVALGTVVAIGSGPFFAGAMEWGWRGVRPSGRWLLGTVITVGGGAMLIGAQVGASDAPDAVGVLFALLAGAGYALYSVTSKMAMGRGVSPTQALAAPFTVGVILVGLLAARQPYGWVLTGSGAAMSLHLGFAATGAAYLLFAYGLRRLTTATTVTLVLAEPLTATLLAVVMLDERLAATGWIGVGTVLIGLVVVGRAAEVESAVESVVASEIESER